MPVHLDPDRVVPVAPSTVIADSRSIVVGTGGADGIPNGTVVRC